MDKEDPTQGIPEWLQPFADNLEDLETHVPAHSSQRENSDSDCAAKVVIQKRKHNVSTHFAKDWNCDVCLGTKITRVSCRRRYEGSIPRAEKFGNLINVDHEVLKKGSESRNNHRYAVVVQDLATQWIQSYPCNTKTSQETEKSLRKFLEPSQWANKVKISMESSNIRTSSTSNKRNCRTSCTTNKRRNVSSIIAIWIG